MTLLSLVFLASLSNAAIIPRLPPPEVLPAGWDYMGCYVDIGRSLGAAATSSGLMTAEACINFCTSKGMQFAGTEYHNECYCDSSLPSAATLVADSECSTACSGDATQSCGGPSRLTVYHSAQPVGPQPNPGVNGFNHIGCYTEGTTSRALPVAGDVPSAEVTAATCTASCLAKGFKLAGVEYGGECYCGNSLSAGSVPAAGGCNTLCNGNSSEICGGPNRLNLYNWHENELPTASVPPTPSTTTSAATGPGSTAPPPPVVSDLPEGFEYHGCWIDGPNGRALPDYQAPDSQTLTQESCAQICSQRGYTISGSEYSTQCFCANAIYNGGSKTTEAECSMPCSGNPAQKCGAGNRLTIFSRGEPQVFLPPAPQTGGLGSWTYQGCYQDNLNDKRTFYWQLSFPNVMTPKMCLDRCAKYGYMAAGLEYGNECYCGDPQNVVTAGVATPRPSTECNVPCDGNRTAICGGGSRLSTYFWTGTPFYSWTFPQTPATAGRYDLLIDAPTIALMTQESITGKVTFLSKWGTGPGSETGAYELDVSMIPTNPAGAWRTLHVKTDIFCSAGVILPDRGARQLNVGGWSGESTEGLRLYWPDGAPGTPGVRDFQENVQELSLQKGRWYPTAMVMANGSVMVIGGQVGSNGAAVPSIEVLPHAPGSAPLYMDWLDRTNPDNLYPFVAVLPGGGILVTYYNEARILDEVTFNTIKQLPKIPGAVNNDLAGRTYPLEGASVLLPQKAPYTAPLGILVCGGSSNGAANALDNCVSIYPEAANPEWVIERMPSFRVMPCMASLPDGTYFIGNGALHGVAGFGLGVGPNLNSLLYDPEKPVGSRITVAANTTIARMYHSEALTLLDGRVLISGSDPEDGVNPQEYRTETYTPPYLLSGKPRPSFTIVNKDWGYGANVAFSLGSAARNGAITVTLLGAVSSTHGNSMGARTLMPAVTCTGTSCTVQAPPNAHVCPPGWYQFFVLDGGIPAVGVYIRIGGDPAGLGNWPPGNTFTKPGVGPV
ncbi:hypothetical protein MCOR27_010609 [Pyricularia oryzae]|uniref:WSC domain-containing protein n=1 Tax=Pyricularia grisea TaxID=148305 RepID=A0ABQ8NDB0_PYRGI|nr:hypothetical protein MCOR01_008296 [Pyricularia oryzae]KAI6294374.1 hypothetical protein MCOR33_008489 [Pyricularia grisea]KAH9438902.1 hypothetical protein MCOR02_002495 [Pyricularia oryzae]KAI6257405.1 hypothetical protein MCOR19_006148 [Pyricularia oryzae]KAI6264012.1 hypothetical protein MCOR26_011656 [Pyricularia oryzae]